MGNDTIGAFESETILLHGDYDDVVSRRIRAWRYIEIANLPREQVWAERDRWPPLTMEQIQRKLQYFDHTPFVCDLRAFIVIPFRMFDRTYIDYFLVLRVDRHGSVES